MRNSFRQQGFFGGGLRAMAILAVTLGVAQTGLPGQIQQKSKDASVAKLSKEISRKGWIIFAAKSEAGDYDLLLARPDGTQSRNITRTPKANELTARFWDGGKRIIYRSVAAMNPKTDYREGTFGRLMIANADGSDPVEIGKDGEFPWATLSPDAKSMACLYRKEGKIRIFEFPGKKLVKELPRQGIFWQIGWSPDGSQLCGTANIAGRDWNIVVYDLKTGQNRTISRVLNCTPDWFPDSSACVYSHRNPALVSDDGGAQARKIGQDLGSSWTMLMRADAQGKQPQTLVVAEQYRHLYFACLSPDNKYVIYCRPERDSQLTGPMAVVRLADTPILEGEWKAVEGQYAKGAKRGPVLHLDLPAAFAPHWTYAEIAAPKANPR